MKLLLNKRDCSLQVQDVSRDTDAASLSRMMFSLKGRPAGRAVTRGSSPSTPPPPLARSLSPPQRRTKDQIPRAKHHGGPRPSPIPRASSGGGASASPSSSSAFNLVDQLTFYGQYHSNKWNQLIHFFCVPTIMWSIMVWLAYAGAVLNQHTRASLYGFSTLLPSSSSPLPCPCRQPVPNCPPAPRPVATTSPSNVGFLLWEC